MPRVSDDHLAARRQQILDAAEACFVREGFHRTTMQDIFREAGLSPGAVYRYFSSKEDIIVAMAALQRERTSVLIEALAQFGGSREVLGALVATFFTPEAAEAPASLDFALWAEAQRDLRIRQVMVESVDAHLEALAAIVREGQLQGDLRADLDPLQTARLFLSLFKGYQLQKSLAPDLDAHAYLETAALVMTGLFSDAATNVEGRHV